ncbi:phosphoinositide 3-kinase regulatory subunit 6-like [Conger conger]|uniref:phosphoinositide 3-kinase regulatory subunit 6-like n=1 Tax=Conger conger TaxID=82655 RepID=UPI002A59EDBB|nr:phosphoinositide 3-kinase regulatory subunit 6-like [Conger conger]
MQVERSKPGALYQRTVIAEHNLWNESFPFQEMVFVFADAALFSGPLGGAVQWHLESGASQQPRASHMRTVLLHTLQAALGNSCHGNALACALKDAVGTTETYFQEVVEAVEHNSEEAGEPAGGYRDRLQRLYRHILSAGGQGEASGGSMCETPLPTPVVRYHLWQEEDKLWLPLEKWIQQISTETTPAMQKSSRISRDSGIEGDLAENETSEVPAGGSRVCQPQGGSQMHRDASGEHKWVRKHCVKKKPPGRANSLPAISREFSIDLDLDEDRDTNLFHFTASVVVMGDDRVLGRLAEAYHALRTGGESLPLMSRVNLEIYYIPVTDQHTTMEGTGMDYLDVASHLGRVDPWYECNINSLAHWIPTLEETAKTSRSWDPNPFLLDVLSYYKRTAWQPVHFTIYSVKITHPNQTLERVFLTHLEVDFSEWINTKVETAKKETTPTLCGPVVSITYRKVSLNNRHVEKGKSCRTTGVLISAIPSDETEDLNHDQLTLSFKETKTSAESLIRSRNIKIKTLENKSFTVRLDKDTRRTYEDVQSIEISPCQNPRCIENKDLTLPINTFSGSNH